MTMFKKEKMEIKWNKNILKAQKEHRVTQIKIELENPWAFFQNVTYTNVIKKYRK